MAFFLLGSLDLGSRPGIGVPQAAAAGEEQARLERLWIKSEGLRQRVFSNTLIWPQTCSAGTGPVGRCERGRSQTWIATGDCASGQWSYGPAARRRPL